MANISNSYILNVAEKNDAAKHIAKFLSDDSYRERKGPAPTNKNYDLLVPTECFPSHMQLEPVQSQKFTMQKL